MNKSTHSALLVVVVVVVVIVVVVFVVVVVDVVVVDVVVVVVVVVAVVAVVVVIVMPDLGIPIKARSIAAMPAPRRRRHGIRQTARYAQRLR